jgi:hypothetical protein
MLVGAFGTTTVPSPVRVRQLHPRAHTRIGSSHELPHDHLLLHASLPFGMWCDPAGCTVHTCVQDGSSSMLQHHAAPGYRAMYVLLV